jgi:flagellin-like hook-associated protein FlgL
MSNAMQRDIFRMYDEINQISNRSQKSEEAILDMHNFITVVLERIELHNEYRTFMFSNMNNHTVKIDSRLENNMVVGGG